MQNLYILKCTNVVWSSYHFASSSAKPSIISRIRYVVNHYWLGSKLLYQNYKSVKEIRKKNVNSLVQFSNQQFIYDSIYGMIPTMQFINQVNKRTLYIFEHIHSILVLKKKNSKTFSRRIFLSTRQILIYICMLIISYVDIISNK